jgi:hypothetical protein
LRPLLFILFINNDFSCFKSLRILLYVDYLKIFFSVAGNSDFANALAELDELNLGKCKSMSFTRHFQYELSGHSLDSVDSICDLGCSRVKA